MLHRRSFLLSSLATGALMPSKARANTGERKFLFLFCPGGWDQCAFAAPLFDSYYVNMNAMAQRSEIGGITFVDHPEHSSLSTFLQRHASKTALINGVESRSVAHDVCIRLMFTSAADTEHDDWASLIAAHAQNTTLMPNVVFSGPSFTHQFSDKVLRVGGEGQLLDLLTSPIPSSIEQLEDQYVQQRLALHSSDMASVAHQKEQDLLSLEGSAFSENNTLKDQLDNAVNLFEQDQARVISLAYHGVGGLGWDTHAGNHMQHWHLQELFSNLDEFLETLSQRTAQSGQSLSEEVTLVVFSEMGRFPRLNFRDGRDHTLRPNGNQTVLVQGGYSIDDISVHFDNFEWKPHKCSSPKGQVKIRDSSGYWYTLDFLCSSTCAEITWYGEIMEQESCLQERTELWTQALSTYLIPWDELWESYP